MSPRLIISFQKYSEDVSPGTYDATQLLLAFLIAWPLSVAPLSSFVSLKKFVCMLFVSLVGLVAWLVAWFGLLLIYLFACFVVCVRVCVLVCSLPKASAVRNDSASFTVEHWSYL